MQSFPRVAYDVICHITLTSTTRNYGHVIFNSENKNYSHVTLATPFQKSIEIAKYSRYRTIWRH